MRNLDNGVFNALIEVLGSKIICWEESNASKKGYEMLKKYNLTEDELKIAKENMDNALEMYKNSMETKFGIEKLIVTLREKSLWDKIRNIQRVDLVYKNINVPGKFYLKNENIIDQNGNIITTKLLENLFQLHVKDQPENLIIYRPQRFDIRELIRGSSEYFGGPLETINCGEVYIDGVLQESKYYIFQNKLHVMPS